MKFSFVVLIFEFVILINSFAQTKDSLVRFSDIKFHSEYEKEMFNQFRKNKQNGFEFFLAIDEKMTQDKAQQFIKTYTNLVDELKADKIESRKIKRKVKTTYGEVHSRFLKKYVNNESFPTIFKNGQYNCVSASMIYSIIFDELSIPYKVMASSEHVYLIANPGDKSIVIETTNPNFMKAVFNGEYKRQYVNYLRSSKLISESEYKSKSLDEIFEQHFNEVRDASFYNLPGFQYYNAAFFHLKNNDISEGLELIQKAYFFYPDPQVKMLLYNSLAGKLDLCRFTQVEDIDYLAQFARFEETERSTVVGIFGSIISQFLEFNNKEQYCDSLCKRLLPQIDDELTKAELSFTYNLQMSYRFQNKNKIESYLLNALRIKGNHSDANLMLENHLTAKLNRIYKGTVLSDTLEQMEKRYNFEPVRSKLSHYKLIAYLSTADQLYRSFQNKEGAVYLKKFEESCPIPIENQKLSEFVEKSYRSIAVHYFNRELNTTAKGIARRGLKFVPDSDLLMSALK